MMRRTTIYILCMFVLLIGGRTMAQELSYMSQYDRIAVGARVGAASHMQATPLPMGVEAMLDVQYAHYWRHDGWNLQLGLVVGLSAGYSDSRYGRSIHESASYSLTENGLTFPIDYTVDASLRERNQQAQLELPVLFSMVMQCGWFLNVGPRLQLPLAGRYSQSVSDDVVTARYSRWSYQPIVNSATTGCFSDAERHSEGKWQTAKFNLLVGAETGYEYMFRDKNRIVIGAYGQVGVLPMTCSVDADSRLVQIVPPSPEQPAAVSTLGLSNTYSERVNYFSVGVRVAYSFVW